jgi:hypothetical protein
MKAIVCHLSGPKGPRTTLALLDGISAAIVTNSWRPGPGPTNDAKHKWCKETYAAYRAIIEQLEKYWVLAIVHTSTRCALRPARAGGRGERGRRCAVGHVGLGGPENWVFLLLAA